MRPKFKTGMVIEYKDGERALMLERHAILPNKHAGCKWASSPESDHIVKVYQPHSEYIYRVLTGVESVGLIWEIGDNKKQNLIDRAKELRDKADELLKEAEQY